MQIELKSEELFRKGNGRIFAQPKSYPYQPQRKEKVDSFLPAVLFAHEIHCPHLFTLNFTSPSLKKRTICSAAVTPALLFASDVCAPIFFGVQKQRLLSL